MSNTYSFTVEPFTCEGCAKAIKNALSKLGDQVQNVETEVPTKKVTVTTTLSQTEIVEKLKKAGRTATPI